jgi:hypothetical protein
MVERSSQIRKAQKRAASSFHPKQIKPETELEFELKGKGRKFNGLRTKVKIEARHM